MSDLDAVTTAMVEFVVLLVFVTSLVLAATQEDATPGTIFAIMAYVFEFYGALMFFPYVLQQRIRLGDISRRMNSTVIEP